MYLKFKKKEKKGRTIRPVSGKKFPIGVYNMKHVIIAGCQN